MLSYYENKLNEGKDWIFRHHLLPRVANPHTTKETTLEFIKTGLNPNTNLTLTVVRAMHLPKCTFLLCTSLRPFTINSMAIVVITYP